jgi:hypothetical protein
MSVVRSSDVVAQFAWIPEMMLLSLLKRDVTIELKYELKFYHG